jgi:copper(I)-binding protein
MKPLALLPLALLAACSQEPAKPNVRIDDVWARAVAPGQTSGAAYMTIVNDGDAPDRLTRVNVSLAKMTMLHGTEIKGDVASMAMVDGVDVPAEGKAELKPGGTHVMMTGLTVPLSPGDRFFVDLEFAKSGKKTIGGKVVAAGER